MSGQETICHRESGREYFARVRKRRKHHDNDLAFIQERMNATPRTEWSEAFLFTEMSREGAKEAKNWK
jgi:hypothetical protein